MVQMASDYFRLLSDHLLNTSVTDRNGAVIGIDEGAQRLASELGAMRGNGSLVALVGNGGSAAIVDHMHNDLGVACGLKSLVFTNTPSLTAVSNDFGYQRSYERQLQCWAEPGSALIAVSSSGMSDNILRAVEMARSKGMTVYTMSGFKADNSLRQTGDINFYVESKSYGIVELAHSCIAHYVTDRILSSCGCK